MLLLLLLHSELKETEMTPRPMISMKRTTRQLWRSGISASSAKKSIRIVLRCFWTTPSSWKKKRKGTGRIDVPVESFGLHLAWERMKAILPCVSMISVTQIRQRWGAKLQYSMQVLVRLFRWPCWSIKKDVNTHTLTQKDVKDTNNLTVFGARADESDSLACRCFQWHKFAKFAVPRLGSQRAQRSEILWQSFPKRNICWKLLIKYLVLGLK